ncbi:MAG: type 4a pilus biogenesis protein PilO [Candidatus Liptonbacteria bacterium]|nr:type 4a pilus biogenesis protein PilO [Candidatus Liptonbacteria bacterium]
MKQTAKRFLSLIVSFILFASAMVIYFNLILPANDENQHIKAEMIGRQEFVDGQKAAITQVQGLINSYKGEGELQNLVSSILPVSPDLAGAFSQISGLIQVNKLLLQGITVNAPVNQISSTGGGNLSSQTTAKPFASIDLQVKMAGSYGDFKSFMKNLETNVRIFDVKRIDLQPTGKSNQDVYLYNLTVTTYYQTQ